MLQYTGAIAHWVDLCLYKGWSPFLTDIPEGERVDRVLYFMSYERVVHKLKASSIRSKMSAIRWMHLKEKRCNPLEGLTAVQEWLNDLAKQDGPAEQKVPVPIQFLECILTFLKTQPEFQDDPLFYEHRSLKAALLTGFWFLLRSIEYLAEDNGEFDPDRSLTWGDVQPWKDGKRIPLHRIAELAADEASLTLYSGKNSLETCTRTLQEVPGSEVCVVAALRDLYEAYFHKYGHHPPVKEAVFRKNEHHCLRRKDISAVLKLAAQAIDPSGKLILLVASHSLRRGGSSQYVAAHPESELAVAKFGRWTSTAYKAYVYQHSTAMHAALQQAVALVPRYERN